MDQPDLRLLRSDNRLIAAQSGDDLISRNSLLPHVKRANIPRVELQDFTREYQLKADEELLRLALDAEQLTPEANLALDNELARRGINDAVRLGAFHDQEKQLEEKQRKEIGNLFVFHPYGIGRKRFGKAQYVRDPETGMERFKTTVFIVLFWFPLIPTGTFLVERKRALLSSRMTVLEKLPLDWEQVLTVWILVSGALLAIIWSLKLLPRLLFRR